MRRPAVPILIAIAAALPGLVAALMHLELSPEVHALLAGCAILGASFLLVWACDAAQTDISQSLALAVVALIAVLPEYAVSMYFTWQAGKQPESEYAHYALANMTGANRLIIGIAWAVVAVIFWIRTRKPVNLGVERALEVRFLALATIYAFVIPAKGSLAWYDGVVFIGLFIWYVALAGRRPPEEPDLEGPGAWLASLPRAKGRALTWGLFVFAAGAILANAEGFCEGLVATGKQLGVNEFVLVQWVAPIASEAPEFVIATLWAMRRKAGLALGSLLSSKLNQWTLLVGMIPGTFALSRGSLDMPLPMGHYQMNEVLLTAAQSLLAVVMLAALRLSVGQATLLFSLFVAQLVAPPLVQALPGGSWLGITPEEVHPLFSLLYLAAALAIIADRPGRLANLWRKPAEGGEHEICPACGSELSAEDPVEEESE